MQITNCPRCNMFLAPGAPICPNCQLNLQQMHYQQPVMQSHPMSNDIESRKEKVYRKLLITLAIVLMSEFLIYKIPSLLYRWFGTSAYSWTKPFTWLTTIGWAGLPLLVALLLPKKNGARVVLIVFASIYALWKLGSFMYDQFVYTPWDDYPYPPVDYNF